MNLAQKFYLPQLDGLRFFAFLLVFFHHFMPSGPYFSEKSIAHWIAIKLHAFGWIGVDVFFCLSSFLLTALLILEHRKTGSISIKQFYIRRSLRIWPLYYLIIVLAFLVFPLFSLLSPALHTATYSEFAKQHLLPFSLFLGNFSYTYFTNSLTVVISPLWTISLEEQFYLLWPILLFVLLPRQKKWFFIALTGMIVLSVLVRFYVIKNSVPYPTIWVFTLCRLDPFALGAAVAYVFLNPHFKPRPILAVIAAIVLFKLAICSTGIGLPNTIWQLFVIDLAAALLIYAALYSSKLGKILSVKPLPWLGKISFGLYIFHDLMIQIVGIHLTPHLHLDHTTFSAWVIACILTLLCTILCASISYYGFEKYFLKLKNRFTIVASRAV